MSNDNNNFGKHAMGGDNWAPSSRVLQQPGGASSLDLFGGAVSPQQAPAPRRAGGARIVGGKIILPENEASEQAERYNAAMSGGGAPAAAPAAPSAEVPAATDGAAEMRGCEGYKPNLAAFEGGGLQSSSTELKGPQQVGRSSTRLHAPPGGASSIVFG